MFPDFESISISGPNPALSLRFYATAIVPNTVYFDNIVLDPAAPVPEPASLLLFASGLAGVAFRSRRQR